MDALESSQTGANVESAVLAVLTSASATPTELRQRIKSKVRLTSEQLGTLLDGLVAQRKIHGRRRKGKSGLTKTIEFTVGAPPPPSPPARDLAPTQILTILEAGAVAPGELKKRAKQALPELAAVDFAAVLAELVAAGKLHARRKRGKNGKPTRTIESYVLGSPPAADFIAPVLASWKDVHAQATAAGVKDEALLEAFLAALNGAGFKVTAASSAAGAVDDRADVLRSVRVLEAREGRGALIPIRKLREALRLDKTRLDAALLALYADDAVILHHHDYVGNLTDAERNALVLDGYGNYYVGVALRGDA